MDLQISIKLIPCQLISSLSPGNYENNERHGEGFLDKADGEKRNENWKKGKLVNFTVVT